MNKEVITDWQGNPIGVIKDGKVTDWVGRPKGSADKKGTRDFTGNPISQQNVPGILLDKQHD